MSGRSTGPTWPGLLMRLLAGEDLGAGDTAWAMREVMTAFYRPGQDALLAGYADKYLALLPSFDRGGMIPSMVYSGRLLPRFGVGADFPARAEKAVTDAAPVVRQIVLERADLLRRMLRTRAN